MSTTVWTPSGFRPEQCAPHRETVRQLLGVKPTTVLALLVAHNFQLKGLPTLLGAIARLRAEGRHVRLAVVGGKRLRRWQRLAESLGVARYVTFVGPVADSRPYYAAADLYVHPTFYDPCSLVVLEAAACGLPVVTSRRNGASELFREGVEMQVISDPADPDELAASMRAVLPEPVRRAMGQAARRVALRHTFDHNVDQIVAVYEEIVARRGGHPDFCPSKNGTVPFNAYRPTAPDQSAAGATL